MSHIPVLLKEVVDSLDVKDGEVYLDGTLGLAGHASTILKSSGKKTKIIGFDKDGESLLKSKKIIETLGYKPTLFNESFANITQALDKENIKSVDKILLDLGLSSPQLDSSGRGFSFRFDEPLLMTMKDNPDTSILKAKDLLQVLSKDNLISIIKNYGEERYAKGIVNKIAEIRKEKPIETTWQLVEIIKSAVPASYRNGRLHPATKTFQALRMAVNNELEDLEIGMNQGFEKLSVGGRMAVISFHSLEDRIVKNFMRDKVKEGLATLLNKKPIPPSIKEIKDNPRSRSAKLRVLIKK